MDLINIMWIFNILGIFQGFWKWLLYVAIHTSFSERSLLTRLPIYLAWLNILFSRQLETNERCQTGKWSINTNVPYMSEYHHIRFSQRCKKYSFVYYRFPKCIAYCRIDFNPQVHNPSFIKWMFQFSTNLLSIYFIL